MLAVQVVGAVGGHHEQPLGAQGVGHEGQQLPGRAVRPVEVLQDHDDRPGAGQALQQAEERLEQLGLARVLPTPASPPTSTSDASPPSAAAYAAANTRSS
jgi:hypothetical protein